MIDDARSQLVDNIRIAIADKRTETEVLAAAAELIDSFSDGYNWTGFYLKRGNAFEVGPYIGEETPHKKIDFNQGICGSAASQKKTVVVDDVNLDPRYLACSLSTRSEIVVPLMNGERCLGEIDIDSSRPAFFNRQDQQMLEAIADTIVKRLTEIS
ncbi:MAG: GAF domain-containing protein [candidate division Zixibacteria bacterium]|nr:GAF domain-containing protein [candidate division Zixibacteria bacterium]